mmetsp:Transcript_2223/g.5901  ORF Transcript_2223/g.5901 Transcript_2223/m.5901 type:complete len:426 (-) Transcript_2223:578-1855(-)
MCLATTGRPSCFTMLTGPLAGCRGAGTKPALCRSTVPPPPFAAPCQAQPCAATACAARRGAWAASSSGGHAPDAAHARNARPARRATAAAASGAAGPSVAVLGAGVVGLTSALRLLQELPGSRVTIISSKLGTDTTTAGAAGLWGPYKMSNTPEELTLRWGSATFEHLMRLFYTADAPRAGVFLSYAHHVLSEPEPPPAWTNIVHSFGPMDPKHLALLPARYKHGYSYGTVMCEGRRYLQYLTDAINATGRAEWKSGVSLAGWAQALEYGAFDALCNCCGLGAFEVAKDKTMYPIRGQVMRVRAPWVTETYRADTDFYIIPNRDWVVLGGTAQVGDWSTDVDAADKERIWSGCCALMPSLRHAQVVEDWVGLRPGRPSVRVQMEAAGMATGGMSVVHNYGHGGAGLTLAWGCAGDVVELVRGALA